MTPEDLAHIPLADNHCHGIYRQQRPQDSADWRSHFTESRHSSMCRGDVATTLFYRRLVHALAAFFDCEPTEAALLAARGALEDREVVSRLLRAANIGVLFLDKGYPPQELVLSDAEHSELGNCRVASMLRVELLMQRLIAQYARLDQVIEALKAELQDLRGKGYVALKSIAAYRGGLDIHAWSSDEVDAAFAQARREAQEKGSVRLAHKPLLHTLLLATFEEAARQAMPVQFHVGYGDADADMLLANPLHLRAVLEEENYRAMPIVLLHECYPYTRQGAYLAAVYENVYLDLSYGIPLLGYAEMVKFTGAAFDVAPYSKLLYSSDGVGVPELHWMSALDGRRVIATALEKRVTTGELSAREAMTAAVAVLRDNALRLYGV